MYGVGCHRYWDLDETNISMTLKYGLNASPSLWMTLRAASPLPLRPAVSFETTRSFFMATCTSSAEKHGK